MMKTTFKFLLISILAIILISSKRPDKSDFSAKKIQKSFVQVEQNLYASKYEVSNTEYREFLKEIKGTDLYDICLYDSIHWTKDMGLSFMGPYTNLYHWHPAYDDYPVVNITQEAAKAYCEWLTKKYNVSSKKKFNKVVFRLPTNEEWIKAANADEETDLPWVSPNGKNEKGCYLANVKWKDEEMESKANYLYDGSMIPTVVNGYFPNSIGMYGVIGNVSEMTACSGEQKGGNWNTYMDDCSISKIENYPEPNCCVGFRVFMEVVE